MPKNPFIQADPLAGGGGAWGGAANAGAGGFGSGTAQAAGAGTGDDYEVVEIVDEQPAVGVPAGGASVPQNGIKGGRESGATSIAERERAVKRREAALAARGAGNVNPMLVKNFPSCCPIVHHDIVNDIPDYNRNITRAGFMLFVATSVTLMWNFTACLLGMLLVDYEGNIVAQWFLAAVFLVLGIPGAWFTWYGRLYRAMMSDGAMSFAGFFFFIVVHTAFAIYSAVAPSWTKDGLDYAHTGWLPTIQLFKIPTQADGKYRFVAICYAVGAGLWTTLTVFSIILIGRVYRKMRGGSLSERAKQEAYAHGARMAAEEMQRNAQDAGNKSGAQR